MAPDEYHCASVVARKTAACADAAVSGLVGALPPWRDVWPSHNVRIIERTVSILGREPSATTTCHTLRLAARLPISLPRVASESLGVSTGAAAASTALMASLYDLTGSGEMLKAAFHAAVRCPPTLLVAGILAVAAATASRASGSTRISSPSQSCRTVYAEPPVEIGRAH